MTDSTLTFNQRGFLLLLMVEAREMSNPELNEQYRITLTGNDRRKLNDLKLVDSWKQGRAFVHVLTDRGWRFCADELDMREVPAPAGARVLAAGTAGLLSIVHRHLRRNNMSLAEFCAPDDAPNTTSHNDQTPDGTNNSTVDDQVNKAYASLASEPGAWVKLADLRSLLGGLSRSDVDNALIAMNRRSGVNIVPESNQKTLSDADRVAAVRIGEQDKHLLSIGGS